MTFRQVLIDVPIFVISIYCVLHHFVHAVV